MLARCRWATLLFFAHGSSREGGTMSLPMLAQPVHLLHRHAT